MLTKNHFPQKAWLLWILLLTSIGKLSAQVFTNSGSGLASSYPSLASAITALNATTITSPVTLNVQGSETAPAGGFVITASGSAANKITIQSFGATITASPSQTNGSNADAVFKLTGADYVTLKGFTIEENPANTNWAFMTEWGVALLYASSTNGAQNNTVRECNISLAKQYPSTVGIYSNSTHTASSPGVSATATSLAGSNSGLTLEQNTITNVNHGIIVVGPTGASEFNTGINIKSNTVSDFGSAGGFYGYANVFQGSVLGICVQNCVGFDVSFNQLYSSNGEITSGSVTGISIPQFSNTTTATFTQNISNNYISLKLGNTGGAIIGINSNAGSASGSSTLYIDRNNFTAFGHTTGTANGLVAFIANNAAHKFQNITRNRASSITLNTTGPILFISNDNSNLNPGGTKSIDSNSVYDFTKSSTTGSLKFITDGGNDLGGNKSTISRNSFLAVSLTGSASCTLIEQINGFTGGTSPDRTVRGNIANGIILGTGAFQGVFINGGGGTDSVSSNTINSVTSTGPITGIATGTGGILPIGSPASWNFCGNTISGFSTNTGQTGPNAIIVTSTPNRTINVSGNRIYNLQNLHLATQLAGINIGSGTTVNVYNNFISDLRAPNSILSTNLGVIGIACNMTTNPSTVNLSYNSIYLEAQSTVANFATAGIAHSGNGSASTGKLNMYNNIVVNNSVVNASGYAIAFRRFGSAANLNLCDYNNFYVPSADARHLIFYDGNTGDFTLPAYKTRLFPREVHTVNTMVSFAYPPTGDLHLVGSSLNDPLLQGMDMPSIPFDYDGNTRGTPSTMGADEVPGPALPSFAGGAQQSFSLCKNAPAYALNNLLKVSHGGLGQTLTWTPLLQPAHGSLGGFDATAMTNGGNVLPPGLSYTPAPGYDGSDAFSIITTDGALSDTILVNVTVLPLPAINAGNDEVVCAGSPTFLFANGGSAYVWSNGVQNGNSFYPSGTATYTVTGTGANGCTNTDEVTITVNPPITIDAGPDQTVCSGSSVTLTGSGDGALSYSWNNSVTDGVAFTAYGSNTYTLTATDVNGCNGTDQVDVNVIPKPIPNLNTGSFMTICKGTPVTLTATGSATYTWNGGITNGVPFTPASTAIYTVTGVNSFGCTASADVQILVDPLPSVSGGPDQSTCAGGTVTLSGSGASNYSWTNSVANGVSFTPSATKTYVVTGTDYNGCSNKDTVLVTVNTSLPVNAGPDQDICAGSSVTLSATGAVNYSWDHGITNGIAFAPATTNTYVVSGSDNGSCSNTDTVVVTVHNPPAVSAGSDLAICPGSSVTLSGSGAVSYSWNNGITNGSSFVPSATTTYTVTGTDAYGCINTDEVTVTLNSPGTVSAGADITVCQGASVVLTATGADSYSWNNDVSNDLSFVPATTATYVVSGIGSNGCTTTDTVVVTVRPLPLVDAGQDISVCPNTPVNLIATGADIYNWSGGAPNGSFNATVTGSYTVTGTDVFGCSNTDEVIVSVYAAQQVDAGPDQFVCQGVPVTLSAQGSAQYFWAGGIANGVPFTPTLPANYSYSVTGIDTNGCVSIDHVSVIVSPLPSVFAGPDQTVCSGSPVVLSGAGGGSGPLTYTWDHGVTNVAPFTPVATATYTVTGTDNLGCSNTDSVNVTVTMPPTVNAGPDIAVCPGTMVTLPNPVVPPGGIGFWNGSIPPGTPIIPPFTQSYIFTYVNTLCISHDTILITVYPKPAVLAGYTQLICAGESVTLSAAALGTPPLTYSWNNGVTDGVPFSPVASAQYQVTATDGHGCTGTGQVYVNVNPLPVVDAGPDVTVVSGAYTSLQASGATVYAWDHNVFNLIPFAPSATEVYHVTGTTLAGCSNTDSLVITVLQAPAIVPDNTLNACINSTKMYLPYTGASGNPTHYSIHWTSGPAGSVLADTLQVPLPMFFIPLNPSPGLPLVAGSYYGELTVGNTAATSTVYPFTLHVLPLPDINAGADREACAGSSVTLTATGAVSYFWDHGVQNNIPFKIGADETYTVLGIDSNGCSNTDTVIVTVHVPDLNASGPLTICKGQTVVLEAPAGSGYTWKKNGAKTSVKTNSYTASSTATYTVTYTDSVCGAASLSTFVNVINLPAKPLVTLFPGSCEGDTALLQGPPASGYQWQFNSASIAGATNSTYETPVAGNYQLIITDKYSCVSPASAVKKVKFSPLPVATIIVNKVFPNGSKRLQSVQSAASYQWYLDGNPISGATARTVTITQTGQYALQIVSKQGCSDMSGDTSITVNYTGSARGLAGTAEEENEELTLTVYPNPSTGLFRILSDLPLHAIVRDLQGRVVIDKREANEIDLTDKTPGVYLLALYNDQGQLVKTERLNKQ